MASPTLTDEQLKEQYGLRPIGTAFDEPFELGYKCPLCHTNITWSEFNDHIWCYKCKIDYLSFDCPITRPCWMNKRTWDKLYGNYPERFNLQKSRVHPYPDCRKDGKLHKCVQ